MPFVTGKFALAAAPADAAVPVVLFVPAGTATGADTAIPYMPVQFAAVQAVARIGKIVSLMMLISAHQQPRRDTLDDTHHSNNKIAGKEKSHGHTYDETSPGNAPVRRDKQQPRQCKRDHTQAGADISTRKRQRLRRLAVRAVRRIVRDKILTVITLSHFMHPSLKYAHRPWRT
jgi:hypothetical protein